MRKLLEPYLGKEITITAVISEIEEVDFQSVRKDNTVLITEIKEKETKKFLADHLWCDKSKFELLEPINIDDNIEITGKVAIYPKALYNSHVRNKFDYYIDFKSEDVKKIEKENDDLKVTFYTDICKSRVIQGHKFKLLHLENIYKILISKKYSYIRFIKDMIKVMFLSNPNYEMVLVINTKGSMYVKKINYNKPRYIKSNELMLCKIGKNVLRFGKVYSDYADVLESQGMNEGPSIIIEKWDILSKNNKNKIRIVNENLDDIIKPYLKFMELLKASLALEIEYNSKKINKTANKDVCTEDMNFDKINTPRVSNDSLIFQTSLMKSRVAEDYYFNLEDLDIIYSKLCKKRFHILINIFDIIKSYLNNNIEYDTVLIIDYKGSIYDIEVDRECENRSDYLRDGEIEICRFGKKVIKKSNIYHDYSKALEKQGMSRENLHIWDKWYELDNENIVKKSIVDMNFHQRKNGYIKHYDALVAGVKKELEIQKIIYS